MFIVIGGRDPCLHVSSAKMTPHLNVGHKVVVVTHAHMFKSKKVTTLIFSLMFIIHMFGD